MISQYLIKKITCTKAYYHFTEESMNIIFNSRKSFLFLNNQPWEKKGSEAFDVTMGSYDDAEICVSRPIQLSPQSRGYYIWAQLKIIYLH